MTAIAYVQCDRPDVRGRASIFDIIYYNNRYDDEL